MTVPNRFKNRVVSDYVQWTEPGQSMTGFYLGQEKIPNAKKEMVTYLRLRDGERTLKATCPPVLGDLLLQVDPGTEVHIVYKGEEPRQGGSLKVFEVYTA